MVSVLDALRRGGIDSVGLRTRVDREVHERELDEGPGPQAQPRRGGFHGLPLCCSPSSAAWHHRRVSRPRVWHRSRAWSSSIWRGTRAPGGTPCGLPNAPDRTAQSPSGPLPLPRPPPVLSSNRLRAPRAGQGSFRGAISRPPWRRRNARPKPNAALARRGGLRGRRRRPRPRPEPSARVHRLGGRDRLPVTSARGTGSGASRSRRRNRQRHLPRVRDGQRSRDDLRGFLGQGGPQHLRPHLPIYASADQGRRLDIPEHPGQGDFPLLLSSSRAPIGCSRHRRPCPSGAISGPCSKRRDTTRRRRTSGRRPSFRPWSSISR